MTLSFSDLKKSNTNILAKLQEEVGKLNAKGYEDKDEGYWYPAVDKVGNGGAIIRFLPASPGEEVPFVRIFNHGFEGPTGQWYVENCPTTHGKDCPVCAMNKTLWNSGIEENKKLVSKQKRKLNFISNIYVIKDPMNPENEGKVFLFKFGKKVFDKLNFAMNPAEEAGVDLGGDDEDAAKPMNPFDLWEGANFRLIITKKDGYRNYDKSHFEKAKPLLKDDKALEEIWKTQKPLLPLIAEKEFKSYTELSAKLNRVLVQSAEKEPGTKVVDLPPWEGKSEVMPETAAAEEDEDITAIINKIKAGVDE